MKLNRYQWLVVVAVLGAFITSCAAKSSNVSGPISVAPASYDGSESTDEAYGATGSSSQSSDATRMIVRSANVSMVVQDTDRTVEQIRTIVAELGGYVVDLKLWRDQEQLRGTVTVRVPAAELDQTLIRFKGLAVKVERESGSSQDVTEEYSDLGAQLRNLEAAEKELQELLTTVREKTGKAEDIMAVYRELTQVRGQIEGLKGRMQYLQRTAEMSSVMVELIPDVLAEPITVGGWRPSETVARALRTLVKTLRGVVDAAIWIILYIAPVLLVIALPVYVLGRLWNRRKKGGQVSKA